jgi:hypothetical protein
MKTNATITAPPTLNQFNKEAQELIQRKIALNEIELSLPPIEQLKDHKLKLKDFFHGLNDAIYWDFLRRIDLINLAFEALEEKLGKGTSEADRATLVKSDTIRLIQHIGFNKHLIYEQSEEVEIHLNQIEEAENAGE